MTKPAYCEFVFVYGTLRFGGPGVCEQDIRYFQYIEKWVKHHGEAVLDNAQLVSFGNFPGLYPGNGAVYGDLFQVHPKGLDEMDRIEKPFGYTRSMVQVRYEFGVKDCWTYWAPDHRRDEIIEALPGGNWLTRRN